MVTRRAGMEDLGSLTILFDNYRKFYKQPADIIGAEVFLRDRMFNKESVVFIAENDNEVMTGFVQLFPIFSSTRMKRLWLLNDLFIEPEFRGKGISIALINECKNLCRKTNSCGMILETAKTNTIGNRLYAKTDFLKDADHNYFEWQTETD